VLRSTSSLGELLERCREQDESAWAEFRSSFHRIALRVLARFRGLSRLEKEEAEDTARVAVAIEISEGRVKAKTDGEAVSYARTVVTNAARDVWRRRRPGAPLPMFLRDGQPSPLDRASVAALLRRTKELIDSWSAENRFVFMMKLENVSTLAIKEDLERLFGVFLTPEAVDVRFFRLRAVVREYCSKGDAR